MKSKDLIRSIIVAELVLLVPLIAMLFTDEVKWDVADFLIVGLLLAGIGVAYQLIRTGIKNKSSQTIIGIILAGVIILMWLELAVGIFGTPFAGS